MQYSFHLAIWLWLLPGAILFAQPVLEGAPSSLFTARQQLERAKKLFDAELFAQSAAEAQQAFSFFQSIHNNPELADAALVAGRAWYSLDSLAQAESYLQACLHTALVLEPNGSVLEAKARTALCWNGTKLGRNAADLLAEAQKALAMLRAFQSQSDPALIHALTLIGRIYRGSGQYPMAIPYYQEALDVTRAANLLDGKNAAKIMVPLGLCYASSGNFDQAISILELALEQEQKTLLRTDPRIASCLMELGNCKKALKKLDDALECYARAAAIFQNPSGAQPNVRLAYSYSEIGQTWMLKGQFDKALSYFQQSVDVLTAFNMQNDEAIAYTYRDMGQAQFMLHNYALALQWQQKALQLMQGHESGDHLIMNQDAADIILQMGRTEAALGHFDAAIQSFEANQRILKYLFGPEGYALYESEAALGDVYQKLYAKTGVDSLLEKSRQHFQNSEKGIEQRIKKETNQDVQTTLLHNAVPYFESAIKTEMLFFKKTGQPEALQKAWQLSESMHSYLLYAATQESNARHYAGIPDEELVQDSMLRAETIDLEKMRQTWLEAGKLSLGDSAITAIDVQISAKKDASTKLSARFAKQYPAYFKLKYDLKTASLAETQQMLTARQTLLEYYTGDSTIFVFVLQHNTRRIVELPRDFPLADWVRGMREGIVGYHTSQNPTPALYEKTVRQYAKFAQQLYAKLLQPIAEFLTEELIIIPGDQLNDLPFEVLLATTPRDLSNFNTYDFVMRKRSIHYAYSATMLQQMSSRKHRQTPSADLMALAPFYVSDTSVLATRATQRLVLAPLPYSREEIQRVQEQVGGNDLVLSGQQASKKLFLKMAGQYSILHLATHGKANHREGDFSFLAFATEDPDAEKGLLSVGELYNCSLNADLVVLSACETGIGEEQRGEGVVSLARAFAFAGAKSIVSSLWSVNDKSTMQVMDGFYAELKAGRSKNLALNTAKQQYLEQHPGKASHPFFWAGFVAVGDMSALQP